ncbi:MAG: TonB-dependent receptor, partial [Nitrospirae bacterium]
EEESDQHTVWQLRAEKVLPGGRTLSASGGENDFHGFMRFPFRLCKHLIRSDARSVALRLASPRGGEGEWRLAASLDERELTLLDNGAFERVELVPHPELTRTEVGLNLEATGRAGPVRWVAGGEVRRIAARSGAMLDGDLAEFLGAAFAQGEWRVAPPLSLFAGLRLDTHYDANPALSPFAAVVWVPRPRHTLRLSFNLAHRFPNLYEGRLDYLQEGGNPLKAGRYQGDRDLDPEEVTTWEIGYRAGITPRLTLGVTAYLSEARDNIQMRFVGNFTASDGRILPHYRYANVNDQRTLGWDAEAVWRPGPAWRLFANASQARVEVSGEDLMGEEVLPDLTVNVGVGYRPVRGPFGRVVVHWVGPSDWRLPFYDDTSHRIEPQSRHLSSYTTVDVNLGTTAWEGRLVADLTLTNLLHDRHFEWVINEIDSRVLGRLTLRF